MQKVKPLDLESLQAIAAKSNLTIVPLQTGYILVDYTVNEVITWQILESLEEIADWLSEIEN